MASISLFSFSILLSTCLVINGELALLRAKSANDETKETEVCISYNPEFQKLPSNKDDASYISLEDVSYSFGCSDIYSTVPVQGKVVAVKRGNCTFGEKAEFIVKHGGAAALFVGRENGTNRMTPAGRDDKDYHKINITMSFILWKDFQTIKKLDSNLLVSMYSPVPPTLDPNMICIFLIAVFCVLVGAYWSGVAKYYGKKYGPDDVPGNTDLNLSPLTLILMVVLICGLLVLLYFFFNYLVYFLIGLFTLASAIGLFSCFQPVFDKLIPCDARLPITCCQKSFQYKHIVLAMLCCSLSVFWAVERNASYAWVLQNFLGVAFIIHMLKTLRLTSLKTCTILLVLLFFYDIFFVFITPLFTQNGESVMVKVATGGDGSTGEQLPIVFKFPKLLSTSLSKCHSTAYSLLGFGDVLVPGLLVSYNHWFDLEVGSPRIYFISTLISYAFGLAFTFAALAIMQSGQPALLYLVPCTLIVTFGISLKRKEFTHMWYGEKCCKKNDDIRSSECVAPESGVDNLEEHVVSVDTTPIIPDERSA